MKGHQQLKPVEGLTPVEQEEFRKGEASVLSPEMCGYYAPERGQGKLVSWVCTGSMGGIILQQILDMGVFTVTSLGRITALEGLSGKLIAVAEAAGYSQEICGYHKVIIGYALLLARGQLELVPEIPRIPRPDVIWTVSSCPPHQWTGEAMGRILDVPVIAIDRPFEYDEEAREGMLDYVEGQLREALDNLETWAGRPFEWPRLVEHIRGLAEVAGMRNEVNQLCKSCRPSVCNDFDLETAAYAYRGAPVEQRKGVYRALKEEIQGRIERGEKDVPEEKIRIAWEGVYPWGEREALHELLARYGATLTSSYLTTGSPIQRGMGLDPGNPLRTLARLMSSTGSHKSFDLRMKEGGLPTVEGWDVDGIIFNNMRTCKIVSIPLSTWAEEMAEELGISTLIIESDAIDPAFYAAAQSEKRIESFLEGIAERKARV